MSSEMVERVAQAISVAFHEEGYVEGESDPSLWVEFQKAARSAIEAMREPTEAMMRAMNTSYPLDSGEPEDVLSNAYEAAINEALKDG